VESQRVAYETARLRLARYRVQGDQARARAAAHAAQVSAEALAVERVGVWLSRGRGSAYLCASQYTRSTTSHSSGQQLSTELCPSWVKALAQRRVLAVEDARNHPSTRELDAIHLRPHGIASLLAAPIIRDGHVVGVVSHEHSGELRCWNQREIDFAGSVADIVALIFEQSDRLELEAALQAQAEQRMQGQKMEALGRMAIAIAHDSNNLLGTIALTISTLFQNASNGDKELCADLEHMIAVGRRLNQQLVAFGRERPDHAVSTVDLRALVAEITPLVRTAVGPGIAVEVDDRARDPRVIADRSQIEQVVLNLALNARDAISAAATREGKIIIALRDVAPLDDVAPDCVILEVRDNGTGMDDETIQRIFEPFFTTKDTGTGLGLATVYGIVRRSGGCVRVTSELGVGTTMLVSLPRAPTA
jgi:two-component system, cell cycle sensor histidine kinase and response regulator CckA